MNRPAAGIILCVAASLCGCVTPDTSLYDWGGYEASLLRMYSKPGGFDAAAEIQRLSAQIDETEATGKRVPPGIHAHVGHLCRLGGDHGAAAAHFEAEKQLFPESARLMDRLLEGLR